MHPKVLLLKTSAAMTGVLIWLLVRWENFPQEEKLPAGMEEMLKSVAHLSWYSVFEGGNGQSYLGIAIFKSFCCQSPASVTPWIWDVMDTSQAVVSIYDPVPDIAQSLHVDIVSFHNIL